MIEYRNIKTEPENESLLTRHICAFGYSYTGSREVYNDGVKVDGQVYNGDNVNVGSTFYNTFTNYITMNFSRDTKMPHYEELRNLENKWNPLYNEWNRRISPPRKSNKKTWGIGLLVLGIALFLMALITIFAASDVWFVALILPVPGSIVCFALSTKFINKGKKDQEQYLREVAILRAKQEQLITQMEQLVLQGQNILDGE